MDWANERYVRLYTRDTADMVAVGWEGRAVLAELLRKVDRSGVLEHGGEVELVPEMLRIPKDLFLTGFARLLKRDVIAATDTAIVLRNFIEAQETPQSDAARKRSERERRRTTELSRPVTHGHAESQNVTPSLAEPSQAKPNQDPPNPLTGECQGSSATPPRRKRKPKATDPTPEETESATAVLAKLSERSGRDYRPTTLEHLRRIVALLRDGYEERDLRLVVWDRANRWSGDPKMDEFLRPSTVFGPQKFPDYLAEARAAERKEQEPRAGPRDSPSPLTLSLLRGERP